MWEVIPEIPETPASDFEYYYSDKNKGILITAYTGTSTEIRIRIIQVSRTTSAEITCTKGYSYEQ